MPPRSFAFPTAPTTMTETQKPYLPKIYSVTPNMIARAPSALVKHCAALGFDHLLITGFADRFESSQASTAFASEVREWAQLCRKQKLNLLIDLNIAHVARDSALAAARPDWFATEAADDLPDPRFPLRKDSQLRFLYRDAGTAVEIVAFWRQQLMTWLDAGVAGFRCINLADAPVSAWRDLIATARTARPATRFLAWTPGAKPEHLDMLAGCGFDATFSSGAWWDYRSPWLIDEQSRLLRIAPPIAFPDSPEEAVAVRVAGAEDTATRARIFTRALRLAAVTGNGLLVPAGFEFGLGERVDALPDAPPFDLGDEIRKANTFIAGELACHYGLPIRHVGCVDGGACMLMRAARGKHPELFIVVNPDIARTAVVGERQLLQRTNGCLLSESAWPGENTTPEPAHSLEIPEAGLRVFHARPLPPVLLPAARGKQAVTAAAKAPRIAIESITPAVDGGRFVVKRTVGEVLTIEAEVFADGHDKLAVALLWRSADEADWHHVRMHSIGNDRWAASVPLVRIGRHLFAIEAWRDAFASYRDELEKKTSAGLNVAVELEEGRALIENAVAHAEAHGLPVAATLKAVEKSLRPGSTRDKARAAEREAERIAILLSEAVIEAMREADDKPFVVQSDVLRIDVERAAARFSSWYELFPRSQSGDPNRHGTFDDVIKRLPAIQAMGFDTLYFPPIHPIGQKHRKGRNNSLTPEPGDPGSPYAIGSEEGGHDAIHPELGTIEDFRRLRDEAARHGLELALDFAIQCSPDHPWLKDHPDWFAWRPDGTIRYAENPPKKYQDIVNVDFYAKGAVPGLWIALRDVVLFWVKEGVKVFRVDNPHTKPLPFWEWMIADIRNRYPDVIFLSEAFTRPKMMYRLAKVGFSQSYTYFTWRHSKREFTEYMTELTTTDVREYFRPHFFVNTPDINPYFLQRSGRPGFLIRAALATTLSGLWGMYNGFELCEGAPVQGKEEYLDSEKYEIRAWDWDRPGNIIAEITTLNRIRRDNPALQTHLNLRMLHASSDNVLFFMKYSDPVEAGHRDAGQRLGDNVLLVAINLDPHAVHQSDIELPLWELGIPDHGTLELEDLVNGGRFSLHGKYQHVRLDPYANPYLIWRVRR